MNHKKQLRLRHPLPTFGSFSFFQASLWLGVNKVLQKQTKSYKSVHRHLFQCCILIPKKYSRKNPFKLTVPPPPSSGFLDLPTALLNERSHLESFSLEWLLASPASSLKVVNKKQKGVKNFLKSSLLYSLAKFTLERYLNKSRQIIGVWKYKCIAVPKIIFQHLRLVVNKQG